MSIPRRASVFVAALSLAALSVGACSDDTTSTVPEGGDAATDTKSDVKRDSAGDSSSDAPACKLKAPYSSKDIDCNECAEASCCAPINACFDEKDCDDGYVNCLIACALEKNDGGADAGDPLKKCKDQCAVDYPKGKPLYEAFSACMDAACAAPCK